MSKKQSKKSVDKAKAKLVEDKTFGLKNKNKSKKVQSSISQVKNSVNQVNDKKTRKEMEEREKKRMEKLLEKKREEELKALFKSADAPKDVVSQQVEEEEPTEEEGDLYNQIEDELLEEEEMTIEDIIEKERAKITGGTPVTLESFTKWQEFKMEQAKKDEDRRKKAAFESGLGLTGRDLFEHNKNLFVDDEEAADTDAYARGDDVDEDLFLDDDDEEDASEAAKPDEDEFVPETWKEPKLPKVLLQEYLAAKKLPLPKYESVPLPSNQQGHFIKVVLPHLSKGYPPKKIYSNKKNAEHAAALMAYRDLTKTFLS